MAEKTKTPSIKDVMKKINSMNKEWNILGSGVFSQNLRKLPFKALGFDLPFKGGLPYGQIVTFSGVEHSGKSTAAAIAMARYQQENPGKVCIWVDAENTLLTQIVTLQKSISPRSLHISAKLPSKNGIQE